jgi:hypothetical protein
MSRPKQVPQHLPKAGGKFSKDWRKLLREAKKAGWTWEQRGDSTHYRLYRDERTLSFTMNAGDFRAIKNMRARLAREERLKEDQ